VRGAIAPPALVVGAFVTSLVHAAAGEEPPQPTGERGSRALLALVDARLAWVDRPPPVTIKTPGKGGVPVEGLPSDFMSRDGTMFAETVGASLLLASPKPFVFPLFGLALGVGGGGYADHGTLGAATFDRNPTMLYGNVELPGVGLMADGPGWRGWAMLVPGVDFVTLYGRFHDASVAFDAEGDGVAFSLRFEVRGCARALAWTWWCGAIGPTLVEGDTFLNGGFVSSGAMF
jgi:hypothetical protein